MRYLWVCIAMIAAASCSTSRVTQTEPNTYVIEATSPMLYDGPAAAVERSHQRIDAARSRAIRRMNAHCDRQMRRAALIEEEFSVLSRRGGDLETAGWYGVRTLTFRCEGVRVRRFR
jgi:hypothetical protein